MVYHRLMPQILTCDLTSIARVADVEGDVEALGAGDVIAVRVHGSMTSGFTWQVASLPEGVALQHDKFVAARLINENDELVNGDGGVHTFLLRTTSPVEQGEIVLQAVRAWQDDPGAHPVARATVKVG